MGRRSYDEFNLIVCQFCVNGVSRWIWNLWLNWKAHHKKKKKKKGKLIWSKNRLAKHSILIWSSHAKRWTMSTIFTLVDRQATGTLISVSGVRFGVGFLSRKWISNRLMCVCANSEGSPTSAILTQTKVTVHEYCYKWVLFFLFYFFSRFVRFSRTLANWTWGKNINRLLLLLLLRIYQTWI